MLMTVRQASSLQQTCCNLRVSGCELPNQLNLVCSSISASIGTMAELIAGIFRFKITAGTAEIASELIGKAPYVAVAGGAAIGLTLAAIYKFPECRPIIYNVLVAVFCCRVTRNAQEIGQITSSEKASIKKTQGIR